MTVTVCDTRLFRDDGPMKLAVEALDDESLPDAGKIVLKGQADKQKYGT